MENAVKWHMRLIDMPEEKQIGHRVIGTIKEVKGSCSAGHKVGDQFELSGYKVNAVKIELKRIKE